VSSRCCAAGDGVEKLLGRNERHVLMSSPASYNNSSNGPERISCMLDIQFPPNRIHSEGTLALQCIRIVFVARDIIELMLDSSLRFLLPIPPQFK
jgi:hypothetical protein